MSGYVYFIGSRKHNWYKIGKSRNAAIRIADLGILLPFRIEVISVWKAEKHDELEVLLHEKYSKQRINGEWFCFDQKQVESIVQEMRKAQTESEVKYSNTNFNYAPQIPNPPVKIRGGLAVRIGKLIKENHTLKQQLAEKDLVQ